MPYIFGSGLIDIIVSIIIIIVMVYVLYKDFKKEKKEITPEAKDLEKRLWYIYGFFILGIITGVYSIRHPEVLGAGIVVLAFLIFNSIMFIYKLITLATRDITRTKYIG